MGTDRLQVSQNAFLPALLGVMVIFGEFYCMRHFSIAYRLFLWNALCFCALALITLVLLLVFKEYRICGVFLTVTCVFSMFCTVMDYIVNRSVIYYQVFTIAINWFGPALTCIVMQFFQKKERFRNYAAFFKRCSLSFAVFYVPAFLYISFFKVISNIPGYRARNLNLIPLVNTILPLIGGSAGVFGAFENLASNFLLFLPLGFYLPMLVKKIRTQMGIVVAVSALTEAIQYLFAIGYSDIDDLILNTCGGALGILLYYGLEKGYRSYQKNDTARLFCLKALPETGDVS